MINYIKRKWLFLLIVAILLYLNYWVWFIFQLIKKGDNIMAPVTALISLVVSIFVLIAIWRIVMDLPAILLQLKGIRQLLTDIESKQLK